MLWNMNNVMLDMPQNFDEGLKGSMLPQKDKYSMLPHHRSSATL